MTDHRLNFARKGQRGETLLAQSHPSVRELVKLLARIAATRDYETIIKEKESLSPRNPS